MSQAAETCFERLMPHPFGNRVSAGGSTGVGRRVDDLLPRDDTIRRVENRDSDGLVS